MISVSALKAILEESHTSPEELSRYLRISNMTLRRMLSKPDKTPIPGEYRANFREGVLALIRDQRIEAGSKSAKSFMLDSSQRFSESIFSILGLDSAESKTPTLSDQEVRDTLITIGASEERQQQVLESRGEILDTSKKHDSFSEPIKALLASIDAKEVVTSNKVLAFGALFYLLMPMDFAPDYIPAFGLMDDLGVVTMASQLFAKAPVKKANRRKALKK